MVAKLLNKRSSVTKRDYVKTISAAPNCKASFLECWIHANTRCCIIMWPSRAFVFRMITGGLLRSQRSLNLMHSLLCRAQLEGGSTNYSLYSKALSLPLSVSFLHFMTYLYIALLIAIDRDRQSIAFRLSYYIGK